MLVLSRREGERIDIGTASVLIMSIHRGTVRIGIEAPPEIPITRPEYLEKKLRYAAKPPATSALPPSEEKRA